METLAGKRRVIIAVSSSEARRAIASAFLAADGAPVSDRHRGMRLGGIALQPHQVDALSRLRSAIGDFGGALLCDPVGTGKTYCALAVASSYRRTLVVAPAVLRPMWDNAAIAAHVPVSFVSHESLSRGADAKLNSDLVIVDEAHHARNPATKRFIALSHLTAGRDVLLLTATPIHNRRDDLHALLSLFLGDRAATLSNAELGRIVIRREDELAPEKVGLPAIEQLRWYTLPNDEAIVTALIGLPTPVPPSDGGDGGALVTHSLIRQWASSDAALRGGLMRRRHRAIALIAALESGTYPSRAELTAWSIADDSVQLAFAELVASPADDTAALLAAIRAHEEAVSHLLQKVGRSSPRDQARADIVRQIRMLHRDVPVVAFSQYEDTVKAMFRLLASDGDVGALSGRGGHVANGCISRHEAITRFAPRASGHRPPRHADKMTLLITTDLLSEGVNLQDAGVVIHLDLPWTPARMEQRLGRIARIGSHHARVHSYAIHPAASAEAVARIEQILETKMQSASRLVGSFPSLTPALGSVGRNEPRLVERLRDRLADWAHDSASVDLSNSDLLSPPSVNALIRVAAVRTGVSGFLAACRRGGRLILLGSVGERISDDPMELLGIAERAGSPDCSVDAAAARSALEQIDNWMESSAALDDARPLESRSARANLLRRIALVVNRSRPHSRSRITSLAGDARRIVLSRIGASLERELIDLASLELSDERWLETLCERRYDRRTRVASMAAEDHEIVAIVLLINAFT